MRYPVSSVAGPGSVPAVFDTAGRRWTGSCFPPAASCAPAPDGTCSAGPSHLGPVRRSALSFTPSRGAVTSAQEPTIQISMSTGRKDIVDLGPCLKRDKRGPQAGV